MIALMQDIKQPRVTDNGRGTVIVTLDGRQLPGWSFPVIHRTSAITALCSQVGTAVNAVACVVYFQPLHMPET